MSSNTLFKDRVQSWQIAVCLGVCAYLALGVATGSVRAYHWFMLLALPGALVSSERGRRWFIDWAPLFTFWLVYDRLRLVQPWLYARVAVEHPFEIERWAFGWAARGDVPAHAVHAWLGAHPGALAVTIEWTAQVIYFSHLFVAPLVILSLWALGVSRERYRAAFLQHIRAFTLLNFAAIVVYLLLPVAPPWWVTLNGKAQPTAGAAGNGSGSRFQLGFGEDGFGPSDHQAFYVRDVPVLFFFTGTHDDYHKPSDTADKINVEGLKQVAEFVREIAISVANEPQRIAFSKVKVEHRPTGRGFRVYLGTVPNYSDQSEGMKLDGVRPGSPAEKAGLRAGDIVVKLGKMPIKNVYDYTYALGEMRGGEEVEAVIRRDGKEMTMKITPEKRQ